MEEVKHVLDLFDSAEKWKAYIELSNMREGLLNELKSRLLKEIQIIAKDRLDNHAWLFECDNNHIIIKPAETLLIGITIEWQWWSYPFLRRGAAIWVDAKNSDSYSVFEKLKTNKHILPLQDYEENIQNHEWFPFKKQIPSITFNVDDSVTSVEECLYMAKDNAQQLAENIWNEVFQPFASREIAENLKSFVM